jgi:hypothetical protein
MAEIIRDVLTLSKSRIPSADGKDEARVLVGLFDVLLPSRQFVVHHKVAELGQVSMTTEFLLRLLHSVDGMDEQDVARFLGFNNGELAFVVNEAESRSHVLRKDGRIWLTDAGYALFKESDKPQIFEVQKRTEKVGFDLLSMAPVDRDNLSEFELTLPELDVSDDQTVASAGRVVPDAFRRFYSEIVGRRERDPAVGIRRSLYSVDEVVPADRFSSVVPILAFATLQKPGEPEPALDAWRSGHELTDRSSVVNAAAAFLDDLRVARRLEDENAYHVLAELAPEYLKDYITRGGFGALRFFKETATRAGELRADRPTVGIVGPLYSPENQQRISDALNYCSGSRGMDSADALLWVVPFIASWGASRALGTLIDRVVSALGDAADSNGSIQKTTAAVSCGKPPKHVAKAFSKVLLRPDNGSIPAAVEMLLVPRRIVAITVHSPIAPGRGFPIAVGVLSFEREVVERAHRYLEVQLPRTMPISNTNELYEITTILQWKNELDAGGG